MGLIAGVGDYGLQILLDQTKQARDETLAILGTASNLTTKGYYNATTNSPTLTNTPNPSFPNGAYYDVSVSGTSAISGMNFSTSTFLGERDRIVKLDSQWYRIPAGYPPVKALSGTSLTITDVPDFRGQFGTITVGGVEYLFFARSLTSSIKWKLIITEEIQSITIADLTVKPAFLGQMATTGGNQYYATSLTNSASYWTLLQRGIDGLKILTSSVTNPTEIPTHLGQIGVFTDASFNQTWFVARSSSSSIKWELMYTGYTLVTYLNTYIANYLTTNLYLKNSDVLKILTGDLTNIVETPLYKGQLGVLTIGSLEYFFIGRSIGSSIKWEQFITKSVQRTPLVAITDLNTKPEYVGQMCSYNNDWYLGVSIVGSGTSNWVLFQTAVNGLMLLTSSVTNPTEVPKYTGQIGVFTDVSFNQTFFVARSIGSTQKWELFYTNYTLTAFINAYMITGTYMKSSTFFKAVVEDLSTTPDFRGQTGYSPLEDILIARSVSSSDKWIRLLSDRNFYRLTVAMDILAYSRTVSQKQHKYTHAGYTNRPNGNSRYLYTIYMASDVETFEGGANQKICMTKSHVIDSSDKTYFDVAVKGATYGSVTLDNNHELQVPNLYPINDNTLRCFFRGYVSGSQYMIYRDLDVTTDTFGDAHIVNCTIKGEATVVPLNQSNAYQHYEFYNGSMGEVYREVFMVSEIRKFTDGKLYCTVNLGSGRDKVTSSILARSSDNGATWELLCAVNNKLLAGVNGTDSKYFWEASVYELTGTIVIIGRGVPTGPALGLWMVKVDKTALYAHGAFTQVSTTSNMKPSVFKLDNVPNVFILNEYTNQLSGTLGSSRTCLEVISADPNFTTFTKKIIIKNANGVHTPSVFTYKDTGYLTYSTSDLREPQIRVDESNVTTLFYGNTTEIKVVELNRRYFYI